MTATSPVLLLTRAQAQSERFAEAVRARIDGLRIVISPVLEIVPRVQALALDGLAGVVLTSENGVRALVAAADPAGLRAFCVGDRTARAAEAAGMRAISAGGAAADLVALVTRESPVGRLLLVRGAHARGDVAGRLAERGFDIDTAVLYDQHPLPLTEAARAVLAGTAPVIVPLFSPRSAALLGDAAREATADLHLAALSPAVAGAWTGPRPARLLVAPRPDGAEILGAIRTICADLSA